jgi:hypothetical protein
MQLFAALQMQALRLLPVQPALLSENAADEKERTCQYAREAKDSDYYSECFITAARKTTSNKCQQIAGYYRP